MNSNFGYVVAMEELMEIKVSDRVEYIRVIMGELNRIASHLLALGVYGLDIGAFTPFLYMLRDRERILDMFEYTCGARLLYNYMWVGGVSHDLPKDFEKICIGFLDYFEPQIEEYNNLLTYNKIFVERTADVGVIPADVAISFGVSGPNLRGSGVKWDVRKDEPYSVYDRFEFDVPVGEGKFGTLGDCFDRYWVRMLEIKESVRIIRQALKDPINAIVEAVKRALEQTPPELGSDIAERGIVLTGGGALLNNIEKLLAEETGLPVLLADNPLTCVARGGGKVIEIFDQKGTDIFDLN